MTCILLVFFHVPPCCRCFRHIAAGWLALRLIPFVLAIIACCLSWKAVARGLMTQWHYQNWYLIAFCFSRTVRCNMHAFCSCLFAPLITDLNRVPTWSWQDSYSQYTTFQSILSFWLLLFDLVWRVEMICLVKVASKVVQKLWHF